MKVRIRRLPPHQNAKVAGILIGVVAAIIIVPLSLFATWFIPNHVVHAVPPHPHPPLLFFLILPFMYAAIGYVATILYCAIYNRMTGLLGGFEFETD